jgi:PIN domain nuclease of toxin-antitoxin system
MKSRHRRQPTRKKRGAIAQRKAARARLLAGAFEEAMPGDPAERIIVATAVKLQARLVTADDRLDLARKVETVW